jgi:hypothetical protein
MLLRAAVALTGLLAVAPAIAEPMNAETARRFVAGKLFAFNCFEGSSGTGRIFSDGSVAGVMRMGGSGPTRFMHLPAGSLYPKEDRICSHVKGAFFNPCFDLVKTSDKSFRGAISGFGFAYCDFTRRGHETVHASVAPDATGSAMRASIRRGNKPHHEKPTAAPTTPVTSAPLPAVEQAAIRSSIAP